MLFAAASSFMGVGGSYGVELLPEFVGGLVTLGWAAVTVTLAARLTPGRDLT